MAGPVQTAKRKTHCIIDIMIIMGPSCRHYRRRRYMYSLTTLLVLCVSTTLKSCCIVSADDVKVTKMVKSSSSNTDEKEDQKKQQNNDKVIFKLNQAINQKNNNSTRNNNASSQQQQQQQCRRRVDGGSRGEVVSTPCVYNLQQLLDRNKIIVEIKETQQDTLKDLRMSRIVINDDKQQQEEEGQEAASSESGIRRSDVVPIYLFQQPSRISKTELPFYLLLVSDLDHIPEHEISIASPPHIAYDSWFIGYHWSIVLICDCSSQSDSDSNSGGSIGRRSRPPSYMQVGWKFTNNDYGNDSFYALIVHPSKVDSAADGSGSAAATTIVDGNGDMISNNANNRDEKIQIFGKNAPGWMLSNIIKSRSNSQNQTTTATM